MWPSRSARSSARQKSRRPVSLARLFLETLEDRTVPSTTSLIASDFNSTKIPAGDTVWFNASLKASGLTSAPTTIHVLNGTIDFTAGTTAYHVDVPNAELVYNPTATSATSFFDSTDNDWDITV